MSNVNSGNNDVTGVLFASVVSCMSLTAGSLSTTFSNTSYIQPEDLPGVDTEFIYGGEVANNMLVYNVPQDAEMQKQIEAFNTIVGFAKKMVDNITPIDPEIQNVIRDHFWEMV